MASQRQCPKCGLDLTNLPTGVCPVCAMRSGVGIPLAGKWARVLVPIALSTAFMLIFHFPRIMIVIFAALILLVTALSSQMKARAAVAQVQAATRTITHPVMFRVLSLAVALCAFALFAIVLFGFVMFANDWSRWHLYEGQPHHRADFVVTRVYFQKRSKGGADVYASGKVDGNREWIDLFAYLHTRPHDQAELEERVPAGTSIPVYLFPGLKGRLRVPLYNVVPPAEAYHQSAMTTLNDGLLALALDGGILFILVRLRRFTFVEGDSAFPLAARAAGAGRAS